MQNSIKMVLKDCYNHSSISEVNECLLSMLDENQSNSRGTEEAVDVRTEVMSSDNEQCLIESTDSREKFR